MTASHRKKAVPFSSLPKTGSRSHASKRRRLIKLRLTAILLLFLAAASWLLYKGMRWLNGTLAAGDASSAPVIQPVAESSSGHDAPEGSSSQEDSLWSLQLVNSENAVSEDYPMTLVEVPGGEQVDSRIFHSLMEMLEAAREANWGIPPRVVSGYRTGETQEKFYQDKIKEYMDLGFSPEDAEQQARLLVAQPGHSEHQLGLAVDINGATYDLYGWLQKNSYQYGFIFRYPGDKTEITGISEEVWHYRYVGVEAATEMYEEGLCLEEYLSQSQTNEGKENQ